MKKAQLKRISEVIASLIGDTERGDLYIIHSGLIGFKTNNAAKVIEKYISLQPEEMPTWQNSLEGVEPVYYSTTDKLAHTAADMFETEAAQEALSRSGQESQKNSMNFMPLYELIARMGNTSGKCYRMSENIGYVLNNDDLKSKQITLGMVKLTMNLLLKASDSFQNNIDKIRNQLLYSFDMQLNFEGKKIDILKSPKRHLVPNLEDFFKMRKHIQMRYFNPLNWYYEMYKEEMLQDKTYEHKLYQDIKHSNEARLASDTFQSIVKTIKEAHNVVEGNTAAPF